MFPDVHDPVYPQFDGRPRGADSGHEPSQEDPQRRQLHKQSLPDVHRLRLLGDWRGEEDDNQAK